MFCACRGAFFSATFCDHQLQIVRVNRALANLRSCELSGAHMPPSKSKPRLVGSAAKKVAADKASARWALENMIFPSALPTLLSSRLLLRPR